MLCDVVVPNAVIWPCLIAMKKFDLCVVGNFLVKQMFWNDTSVLNHQNFTGINVQLK